MSDNTWGDASSSASFSTSASDTPANTKTGNPINVLFNEAILALDVVTTKHPMPQTDHLQYYWGK